MTVVVSGAQAFTDAAIKALPAAEPGRRRHVLAEGESHIAAVRQLSYHALALRDAGEPHTSEAAMVKWMGPKTAFDVIHQCLLTFGHYGWSKDLPHQQRMRDVMGLEIGDGTAGIMKLVIARQRIGRVAVQYLQG